MRDIRARSTRVSSSFRRKNDSMKRRQQPTRKSSLMKHLFDRQIGLGMGRYEASRSEMVRSIDRLHPVHQMQHHSHVEALASGPASPKEITERNYIARLRFNKLGNLVGTSYWSHDTIELWSWQQHAHNHKLPVPTLMGCSIIRFDWLYSNPEAHILVVGQYGDVKLIDLGQLMCYDLITKQRYANMAYGLHPEVPYNIIYGMRDGLVRNFDIRRGPLPRDALLSTRNKDGSVYQIYSLKVNPANCNEFAVAGCAEDVRLYDKRKADRPLHTMYMTTYPGLRTTRPGRQDETTEYAYITDERRSRRWNLQEMMYNYNGTQLALSCGYDSIYLFDTSMKYPIGTFGSNCRHTDDQGMTSSITGSVVYGLEYFGQRSDFMVAMARGHEHVYEETSGEIHESCKRTSLYVWDSFSQKLIRRIPMDDRNWNFAAHPHLPVIATALDQKGIQLWNAT